MTNRHCHLARHGVMLLLLGLFSTAQAHNVIAGAYVDGLLIEGEIGLSNGEMALPGLVVDVMDSAGNKIAETRTGEDGLFSYQATQAMQHRFRADMGAGHIADIVVEAEEFAVDTVVETTDTQPPTTSPSLTSTTPGTEITSPLTAIGPQQLESLIRRAVSQQIKPLQKELRAYKEKVMLRDIAGGLGFIIGLFGIAAWFTSRKPLPTTPTQDTH